MFSEDYTVTPEKQKVIEEINKKWIKVTKNVQLKYCICRN
ncbi:hypothetical protein RW97_03649 [Escherichia coli]|nr:hypothetical protein RW97_03649 [Escherichia coli]OYA97469.1 hypothetical protein RW96_01812 [Escherichia coli]OYB04072.1 hypothetical protein RW98_04368 [Escherichia coli]